MKKITRRQFLKTAAAVGVLGTAASAGAVPAGACIDAPLAAGYPQQVTIGAYDWGPCVSSTQFKLRQSVRAESVHADVFQPASRDRRLPLRRQRRPCSRGTVLFLCDSA